MTNKEAKEKLYMEWQKFLENNIDYAGVSEAYKIAFKALEQEPCKDVISRKSIKQKLQKHHDFFVNDYGGFSNLSQNDKSRVDEITNCIAMVVNEPSVTPQEPRKGHWYRQTNDYVDYYECSECGMAMGLYDVKNYCPNCGSDNREVEDGKID